MSGEWINSNETEQVRALIADLDPNNRILDDLAIDALLDINADNVRYAAADALDAIAISEVLVSKVIRTQDLATDGAKVAASLQARARTLREQADNAADGDIFDLAPAPVGRHTRPEMTWHQHEQAWGL